MIDFENAKQYAIHELKKTNNIEVLKDFEKKNFGYDDEVYISVQTEYMDSIGVSQPITFHLKFPKHFPLEIPIVFLPEKEYAKYKLLPHIEQNKGVCTFDTVLTRTNPNDPLGIAKECLKRAKLIIEKGQNGENNTDFEIEFKSYWEKKYHIKDQINFDLLSLSDAPLNSTKLKLIKLDKKTLFFTYILHQNEDYSIRFLSYLESKNISYQEHPVFNLGEIKLSFNPPLHLRNRDIHRIVQNLELDIQQEFKRFINSDSKIKIVVASIVTLGKSRLIAWRHSHFNVEKINGFRKKSLSKHQLLSTLQSSDLVIRISPTNFSPSQKVFRTVGEIKQNRTFRFLVAGIGSIGSNLIYFLNSFENVEFKFIDFDELSLENIGRHFLGYSSAYVNKAIGMRNYLLDKNPFQKIEVKPTSLLDVYMEEIDFILNTDYLFLTTGNTNVEEYFAKLLELEKIGKPMFLIWVEPYLAGGHCLFLYPGSNTYESYFSEDGYFKFNVIENSEYIKNNPLLSIKEAGCQTTFTPYSQSSVTFFLASIFDEIKEIIESDLKKSRSFSWKGKLEYLIENKIAINKIYDKVSENKIIIHNV